VRLWRDIRKSGLEGREGKRHTHRERDRERERQRERKKKREGGREGGLQTRGEYSSYTHIHSSSLAVNAPRLKLLPWLSTVSPPPSHPPFLSLGRLMRTQSLPFWCFLFLEVSPKPARTWKGFQWVPSSEWLVDQNKEKIPKRLASVSIFKGCWMESFSYN